MPLDSPRRRPSPALLIACLALFVSLSGVAWAATAARNTVVSTSIKNGQVKGVDLAANAISSAKIQNGQVRSADVRDDSLVGADIAEDTLTGVAGLQLRKLNYRAASATDSLEILNLGGLILRASCTPGGNIAVQGFTAVDNAEAQATLITDGDNSFSAEDGDFDVADTLEVFDDLVAAQRANSAGQIVYSTVDGHVVTVAWRTGNKGGAQPCGFSGIAIGS